jgi:phosphoglycolate phosphatase-like HAD superfamily hydrolase
VLTGGAGSRAMTSAFAELFEVHDAFRSIDMPGRTDHWILSDAFALHGVSPMPPERMRFHDVYLRHLSVELEKPHARKMVMPGVRPLLDALSARDDVYLALLTGNFEASARAKLEYFDLWKYFPCGAFGDEAPDRNGLLPKAIARVSACGGPSVRFREAIVIGDTPLDVACAAASGARSIAVATGSFTVDQLRDAGADRVFPDLSHTERVLDAIAELAQ